MSQRIRKIRHGHPTHRLTLTHRTSQAQQTPAAVFLMDPAKAEAEPPCEAFIAYQRKSLEHDERIPWLIKWFLRRVYEWYGFAATDNDGQSYCKTEYRGVFFRESDARWAANCHGGQYRSLPVNAALPEETVGYGIYDIPQSEESAMYRKLQLPFVAVSRKDLQRLEAKVEQVVQSASA